MGNKINGLVLSVADEIAEIKMQINALKNQLEEKRNLLIEHFNDETPRSINLGRIRLIYKERRNIRDVDGLRKHLGAKFDDFVVLHQTYALKNTSKTLFILDKKALEFTNSYVEKVVYLNKDIK